MEELTIRAEQMLEIIEQMKALNAQIEALCAGECKNCPLKHECMGDGYMDLTEDYDIEKCADFLDYHDKVTDRKMREIAEAEAEARQEDKLIRAFEDANRWAGVDPAWANMGRYRR